MAQGNLRIKNGSTLHDTGGVLFCVLLLALASCGVDTNNSLKDEGFAAAEQPGAVERLLAQSDMSEKNRQTVLSNLSSWTRAVFWLNGGSAVFVDDAGGFVSSSHVWNKKIPNGKRVVSVPCRSKGSDVTRCNVEDWTPEGVQTIGKVRFGRLVDANESPVKTPHYLKLGNPAVGQRLISLGYPVGVGARHTPGSETVRAAFVSWLAEYKGLINTKLVKAKESKHKAAVDYYTFHKVKAELAIAHFSSEPETPLYAKLDDSTLALSLGQMSYTQAGRFISNLDLAIGMSGGPVIDVKSGTVIGVNHSLIDKAVEALGLPDVGNYPTAYSYIFTGAATGASWQ